MTSKRAFSTKSRSGLGGEIFYGKFGAEFGVKQAFVEYRKCDL